MNIHGMIVFILAGALQNSIGISVHFIQDTLFWNILTTLIIPSLKSKVMEPVMYFAIEFM
jgi:hypothetical protein